MKTKIDWNAAFKPVFKKYKGRHHPLKYENYYQLIVMVVLSARSSDKAINNLAPALFKAYPTFKKLSSAKPEELYPLVKASGSYRVKAQLIVKLAQMVKSDNNIPTSIDEFVKLPGIGRKSSNVIMYEMGLPAEGVIVDLHVLRVAPRLGLAQGTNPEKIEQQLMEIFPKKNWGLLGMSLTYIGREICRPTDPHCQECLLNTVCEYHKENS